MINGKLKSKLTVTILAVFIALAVFESRLNAGIAVPPQTGQTTSFGDTPSAGALSVLKRPTTPYAFWGAMQMDNMNSILDALRNTAYLTANGIRSLYKDPTTLANATQAYQHFIDKEFSLAITVGVSTCRSVSGPFAWNIIEPEKGVYHFEFPDIAVRAAQDSGISVVATLYPFATWDHPNSTPGTNLPLDFIWWDYVTEYPNDINEYIKFVKALVDRYNGDGINDMPGLTQPVKVYEFGNEPEGQASSTAFNYDGSKYYAIYKITYDAIKAVCPDCKVTNGGTLTPFKNSTTRTFWQSFASKGGLNYMDYFNWHYNTDRESADTSSPNYVSFEDSMAFWKSLLAASGKNLPMLITEIGTYAGTPQNMPTHTQEYQAAYYVKHFAESLANGVVMFFPDLDGAWYDKNGATMAIGTSAMFNSSDTTQKNLFVDSLSIMGALTYGFTRIDALSSSQYLFTSPTKRVLIAWGSGGITAFTGSVRVVDLHGNGQTTNASQVTLSDNPVFIAEGADIVPAAPPTPTATPGHAQATVTFPTPPPNGGTAITGYTVTSNPYGGTDTNAGTTSLTHTVTGLANGTAYTFTVAATNPAGTGPASDPSNSVTPTAANTTHHTDRDFNGDGKSDILLQQPSTTGAIAEWLITGTTVINGSGYVTPSLPGWQVAGVGDFNGDGMSDILLRNSTTGTLYAWLMQGTTIMSEGFVGTLDSTWQIAGVGDFDGDGKSDILLQNTTGALAIWLMNGATINGGGYVSTSLPSGWRVMGVGDFDGDGKSDILLQNTTGAVAVWLMNGATINGGGYVSTSLPSGWRVMGVGDFDGDGKSDILLQNSASGAIYVWLMQGTAFNANTSGYVTPALTGWNIAETGDFNGDGKSDILLLSTDGTQVAQWLMNGTTITGGGYVATSLDPSWRVK